jgi:phospholipid/cholesterol/gamma-HCH transport system substrate-binding protein
VNPAFAGATLFILLGVSIAFAFVSHKGIPGRDYTYATAAFDDVSAGLREGSDVRVQGVRVGQVSEAFYEDGEARAELQLPGGFKIYKDATARIRSRSALGQKYVDIDPGTTAAGVLGDSVIPRSQTASLVELDQVLDALDPDARKGLATGLRELGAGFGGRAADLNQLIELAPELLEDLGTTTAALGSEDADLAGFLVAAERLASRFSGREDEIASLLARSAEVMAAFDADGGKPLEQTLKGAPGALDELSSGLDTLKPAASDLRATLEALAPAARALGQATPGLRGALQEGRAPMAKLPGVSAGAVPAFEGLTALARDARPLVPEFGEALKLLRGPLEILVPYGPEIDLLFDNLRDSHAGRDSKGNWLRSITIFVAADSIHGNTGPNPLLNRNPYPAPGEAATDEERFQPEGSMR